jgi:hypothetical protein
MFGDDYVGHSDRYFLPWRSNKDGSFDQGEFDPSGRADGRSLKVIPNKKVIFKRNKNDNEDFHYAHG